MRCKYEKLSMSDLYELYVIVWRTPKNVFAGVLRDDTKNGCVADYTDGKSLLEDEITLASLFYSFKSLFNDSFNSQHDQIRSNNLRQHQ